MTCSACSYPKAMRRAAGEVFLLVPYATFVSASILILMRLAWRMFGLSEAAQPMSVAVSRGLAAMFHASVLVVLFSRVSDVATMQRYMREFDKPCPICGGKHG